MKKPLVLQLNSTCIEPGCDRDAKDGHVIYRTSSKGQTFEGKCSRHYPWVAHSDEEK